MCSVVVAAFVIVVLIVVVLIVAVVMQFNCNYISFSSGEGVFYPSSMLFIALFRLCFLK